MQNILIVEDDSTQLEVLKNTIYNNFTNWNINTAYNYADAKQLLTQSVDSNNTFTLFLFDVQLSNADGDRGGFFLAKEVRKHSVYFKTPILFLTAVSDEGRFALSEFHCYNYITKPYSAQDILDQLEQMLITGYLENALEITDIYRIYHKICISKIQTIESKSHTLTIHTSNGSITTRQYTLEKILKTLGNDFIQCHRRMIINKTYIETYDKSSQYLQVSGRLIPIGRTYLNNIEQLFTKRS